MYEVANEKRWVTFLYKTIGTRGLSLEELSFYPNSYVQYIFTKKLVFIEAKFINIIATMLRFLETVTDGTLKLFGI